LPVESREEVIQSPSGTQFEVHAVGPGPKVDITSANRVETGSNHGGQPGPPEKKLLPSIELKRGMVEVDHPWLSIRRQCELIGLNRSSHYYQPATESPLNLTLMRLIDEQYLCTPFYGYLKMTEYLRRKQKYQVNPKRVYRLMQLMGLRAVYPRPAPLSRVPITKSIPTCCGT